MKRYAGLTCFVLLVVVMASFPYVVSNEITLQRVAKPWHLQSFAHEDSLSQEYQTDYKMFGKQRMTLRFKDSSKTMVEILVDAWGVPRDESLLAEDFSNFDSAQSKLGLHRRLANRTKHAELVEYRILSQNSLFLFGGDSLEYNRQEYIAEAGFEAMYFCQHCSDSTILIALDSLLTSGAYKTLAWTTQDSRFGEREKLHATLKGIAALAAKHPEVQFIVQGAHRPILGSPEVRKSHLSHWVPVVLINTEEL